MIMEGGGGAKGTVASLSSLFPAQDAHKAAMRVQDAISEKQRELEHLRGFISDNANLINLVQKLPEELHHEVMVPFGKAAFFPGRLVHTNEFLVLLGEGYYAERTSKQTVEILKRRGKALDSQVDSLKAMMDDLKAEASFFDATASEAAEGLVEITEEYVEENNSEQESGSGVNKQDAPSVSGVDEARITEEDEEYARIMSRLDELEEEEELAAANDNQNDEEGEEEKETSNQSLEKLHDAKHSYSKASTFPCQRDEDIGSKELLDKYQQQQQEASTNPSNCSNFSEQSSSKGSLHGNNSSTQTRGMRNTNSAAKSVTFAEVKEKNQTLPASTSEAFTGSIVERPPIMPKISKQETETPLQPSGSQPSKPVSRFKMQRR
ncbi:RNA polymerase II subunit 5-mediating protein homolog [Cucurbita maxima]|uniref:RNA polymerase II subunit 5-mediating protein homolog n=1 Tax=Cucurbita maxima TaxID=3661 RepID=A0A6J1J6D1_CUCMA|nr:RNA polymerase II subunit 5-mediating protein homolog [Cucurbita maxima]XP_022985988.1 RNA polymerase II subunit 5-mediating protein homolog [Cucurbita maxima]XP_022985989.1 RNA polymerase II subunit 5-mediating protein homolog [Cucurbita maxima]